MIYIPFIRYFPFSFLSNKLNYTTATYFSFSQDDSLYG